MLSRVAFADASTWSISPWAATALFACPLIAIALLASLHGVDPSLHTLVTRENGVVEWTQALCLTVALLAGIAITGRCRRAGLYPLAWLYAVLSLGLFFLVGEELAWGQFLFGFTPPDGLARINTKAEMSVHNIESVEPWFNAAKLCIGAYGIFGIAGIGALRRRSGWAWLELITVPSFLTSAFLVVFVIRVLRAARLIEGGYGEYEELSVAYGLAAFTVLVYRRIRLRGFGDG